MRKILVAEDDKFLLNIYKTKLTKEGFEVVTAEDGEEVIEKLNDTKYDLLILDLMMPKKDGFQVLEYIKSKKILKDTPIIIASNLGQKEDIDRALALGAQDYIIKSQTPLSELMTKINTYL